MYTLLFILASLWLFWLLYVFTMGLYRAKLSGRLKGFPLLLASPVVALAFLLDFIFQMTVFTVVFWELPREWLVTSRLRRYLRDPGGWRHRWADYFCHHLLDPYDPTGEHCDRVSSQKT
jgi:hypothetical protein